MLMLLTSGCASLFNPHLRLNPVSNPNMSQAITYADEVIDAYRKGMGEQSKLTSWTGVVLIPLAAATIGLGIQGGPTNAITSMAVGGVAAYGLSTWLSSPNRSMVYAEGISAINCAKQVMLPDYVSDTWAQEFSSALTELSTQGEILTTQLAELHALTSALEGLTTAQDPQVEAAKALADSVTRLLADTAVTRQNGFVLKRRLDLAGQTLVFAVDRIAGEVDKVLLKTESSLSALTGIIANLSPAADMFRQVPTPAVAEPQKKAEETIKIGAQSLVDAKPEVRDARTGLKTKAQEVEKTIVSLARAEGTVRAAVENFEQPISTAALKQCGISENDIIKPLRVLPDNEITMTAGETTTVFLTGGSGQYAATATGEVKGLTVSQPVPLGEAVRIATTTETPATETNVLVKDVAGQTAIIALTIGAAKKEGADGGPRDGTTTLTPFEQGLGLDDIRQIQTALRICNDPDDLTIDGVLGENTRAAAKKCSKVASETLDEDKVTALTNEYLVEGLPKPGRVTEFERRASLGDLKDVYDKLEISHLTSGNENDWFTKEFRTKLKEFQKTHDANPANKDKKIGISGLYTKDFPE
jgi:hypothetical protein